MGLSLCLKLFPKLPFSALITKHFLPSNLFIACGGQNWNYRWVLWVWAFDKRELGFCVELVVGPS